MPLIFPPTPAIGDTYTDDNSAVWQFDGVKWNIVTGTVKKLFNGAKVEFNTAYNLTTSLSVVQWDTETFDTGGYWNVSLPGRIVISQTGYYTINLVLFASATGSEYDLVLKKNGTEIIIVGSMNPNQSAEYYETMPMNAGDYIELYADELSSVGSLTTSSYLEVQQAGLGVGVGVNPSAAFSGVRPVISTVFNTTSTPTAIAWTSTEFDTNANALALNYWNALTPTRITIQSNGYYSIQIYIQLESTGSNYTIALKKNGTTDLTSSSGLNPNDDAWIEETYYLLTNDYVEIFVSDAAATGGISTSTHMEVIRQGF